MIQGIIIAIIVIVVLGLLLKTIGIIIGLALAVGIVLVAQKYLGNNKRLK